MKSAFFLQRCCTELLFYFILFLPWRRGYQKALFPGETARKRRWVEKCAKRHAQMTHLSSSVRQCLTSHQLQIGTKVMSGHIHPADWAVQCIPPWGVWAGIISKFLFSHSLPATSTESNKEKLTYYIYMHFLCWDLNNSNMEVSVKQNKERMDVGKKGKYWRQRA